MGHENEQITETYYGKLSEKRRIEVLEGINGDESAKTVEFSDSAKIALVDEVLRKIGKA